MRSSSTNADQEGNKGIDVPAPIHNALHLDDCDLALGFPLYEHLHNFNLCAQRMIDLLRLIDAALNEPVEEAFYYECLIQKGRSAFGSGIQSFSE
jgi:hypothetical protein